MTDFQWDRIFGKPNVDGIAVGQQPVVLGVLYRLQESDNITVTPKLFYASNSSVTTSNSATQRSGWSLRGGIQTMFKF